MWKWTMNIHITNPMNFRHEHQVQDVTRRKKRGFRNPLTQTSRKKSINKCLGEKDDLEKNEHYSKLFEVKLKSQIKITSLSNEKFKIEIDTSLLSSIKFEGGRYNILTKTPNLTNVIHTTFWQSTIINSNEVSFLIYIYKLHI